MKCDITLLKADLVYFNPRVDSQLCKIIAADEQFMARLSAFRSFTIKPYTFDTDSEAVYRQLDQVDNIFH